MFRTNVDVHEPERRTFENVRHTLEPTLYAMRFERLFFIGSSLFIGSIYPIPYYFEPLSNGKLKAWHHGNLVIDHMSTGKARTVTVSVNAYVVGGTGITLSTMVCPLGGAVGAPYPLKRFEEEKVNVDLSQYDAIGLSYDLDATTTELFDFTTTVLWRPSR